MTNVLLPLLKYVIEGLTKLVTPLLMYMKGRSDVKREETENDAEILKRQRDNNITNVRDADDFWVRLRAKEGDD